MRADHLEPFLRTRAPQGVAHQAEHVFAIAERAFAHDLLREPRRAVEDPTEQADQVHGVELVDLLNRMPHRIVASFLPDECGRSASCAIGNCQRGALPVTLPTYERVPASL